jgi:hypothetical protein
MRHSLIPSPPWIWLALFAMSLLLASCPGGGSGGGY